ncbi:hypothetical protein [uncultured Erythrobacter sp.]|uniref:hypothetical protein n=1 Tax=uncultured Erythrobacter sp. TaxID=263913 RepID=UPI00261E0586|nr:hypothetical protein [uncultured Erythrobacter sp.]
MQALVDLVDSFTGVVRLVILAIFGFGIVVALFMTVTFSVVAPKVAEDYGERAEAFGDRAIEAAREEARARDLADDGWGYDQPRSHEGRSRDADGEAVGGWAEDGR